jgi:ribosomal protein L6P/L9E
MPVHIPAGVEVKVENGFVTVKGPKGNYRRQ